MDVEAITERHARCEILERKRFSAYFQPARRLRPSRLSEGSLSQPPSPIIPDEIQRLNTQIDSPVSSIVPKDLTRTSNLIMCTEEERDGPWPLRNFPLIDSECTKLTNSFPPSPVICSCETNTTLSRSIGPLKYSANSPLDSPRNTPRQSPSPLCSPEISNDIDKNWTVKLLSDAPPTVVASEKLRKGIVLKLAKK